jgi:hypothetical protein
MRLDHAAELVEALFAAFPFPTPPRDTFELYHREFERLQDQRAAADAVDELVRSARRLPPVVDVIELYRAKRRLQTPALPAWQEVADASWEPIPDEALEWLAARGVDVSGLVRVIEERRTR